MDVSDNLNFLAVGYLNGFVALWGLSSSKCKRLVKDAHIKSSIVAIKFLKAENKYYEILTSDLKGSVKKIAITDGKIFINGTELTQYTYGVIEDAGILSQAPLLLKREEYFCIGDNYGNSRDCRDFGPVNEEWIIGYIMK